MSDLQNTARALQHMFHYETFRIVLNPLLVAILQIAKISHTVRGICTWQNYA